jgi:GNAT superfamily N-acetyltransferase
VQDGVVTGFTGTLPRGRLTHLGDLFIRSHAQSHGLGQALFRYALADAPSVITFASANPRAMALYLRAGLIPRCPLI